MAPGTRGIKIFAVWGKITPLSREYQKRPTCRFLFLSFHISSSYLPRTALHKEPVINNHSPEDTPMLSKDVL